MKRYIWPVLFSLLILATSCTAEVCELRINTSVSEDISDFTYYSCTIEQDGATTETGSRDGTFIFQDINPGMARIRISAYSEEFSTEFIGAADMEMIAGPNEIDILLEPVAPRKKDMVLHFPDTGRGSHLTVSNDMGMVIIKDVPLEDSRIDLDALSYGNYIVVLARIENGKVEKLNYSFKCSERTPEEIVFMKAEEDDGKAALEFFDISSSPIEGRIRVEENSETITLELELMKRLPHIIEKDLEFQWYRNGGYMGSGRTIEIEKKDATCRFDCIMKSRYLGSYGSESINISISR